MALRRLGAGLGARAFSTNSDRLDVIALWRLVVAGVRAPSRTEEHAIKDLMAAGVAATHGRHQALLPDELTAWLRRFYATLNPTSRCRLFHSLDTVFGLDHREIDAAAAAWTTTTGPDAALRAADRLFQASQPLYSRLWLPLAQQTDGLAFLVSLRADLLRCVAEQPSGAAPLRAMAESLRRTLAGWFSPALLRLERVGWDTTPAAVLERIAAEERVHSIRDWRALKRRLGQRRRVYVWSHPSLPGRPLVALHVALCDALPVRAGEILGERCGSGGGGGGDGKQKDTEEESATVACFYSISSMQPGLEGIDLGNNLIKAAARELAAELPCLRTFATLSPIPGFAGWLEAAVARAEAGAAPAWPLLLPAERDALAAAVDATATQHGADPLPSTPVEDAALLRRALRPEWHDSPALAGALRAPLLRLATRYLLAEKRRGRALDAVANFHLRNGAAVHRLNWMADASPAGLERSHGVMVNYMYDMDAVEENNKAYVVDGAVAAAPEVQAVLDAETGGRGVEWHYF